MTVLVGEVKDVGLKATVGYVTVRSEVWRSAQGTTGVISREARTYPLVDGRFRTDFMDPGPVEIEIVADGCYKKLRFDLPETGVVSLSSALETVQDYEPAVVGSARAAAAQAEIHATAAAGSAANATRSAQDAENSARRAGAVIDGAIGTVRTEFEGYAARAQQSAAEAARESAEAGQARTQAESAAEAAKGHVKDAKAAAEVAAEGAVVQAQHKLDGILSQVNAAKQAAEAARDSATASDSAAAGHATAAETHARKAAVDADSAEGDRVRAEAAANRAEAARGDAHAAAGEAKAASTGVVEAKDAAEAARDEAVQAAKSATTSAPIDGWSRTDMSQDIRDSLTRADSAITAVPRATTTTPGAVQLAGDLGGTATAPTVPGLSGKLDKSEVAATARGGSVARRTTSGTVKAATPTESDDAATKQYVDRGLSGKVSTTDMNIEPKELTVAFRDYGGALSVGEPRKDSHAATKAYVDSHALPQPVSADMEPETIVARTTTGAVKVADAVGSHEAVSLYQLKYAVWELENQMRKVLGVKEWVEWLDKVTVKSAMIKEIRGGTGTDKDVLYLKEMPAVHMTPYLPAAAGFEKPPRHDD